jgi:hypothetical protein
MVRLTLIVRVHDGLPLAEGIETDKDMEVDTYKTQAKVREILKIFLLIFVNLFKIL